MNNLSGAGVVLALVLSLPSTMPAAELPKDATVLDGDIYFYGWPYPSISPDGQWVAYISQGYVCVCNVNAPARRRIMEVPDSWTWPNFVVGTGESKSKGTYQSLSHGREREEYQKVLAQVTKTIHGLVWKYDSKGFVFGIQDQAAAASDGYFTTVDGTVTKIVHVDANTKTRSAIVGTLSRDGRFLVSPGSMQDQGIYRPIIWNIAENKPRATCFLYLLPSTTSDRWLGVEKDSQQLVIADKDFEVVQRFNETRSEKTFGFELQWSPDERFVVWRKQIGFDYFSNWEGFWMDLKTGEKKELVGHFMGEQIFFTGRGGEFVRCGQDGVRSKHISGSQITGAHLTIDPGGKGQPKDIWRVTADPPDRNPGLITHLAGSGPLRMSPDANLFAVCLPQMEANRAQGRWHMMDRAGRTWRLPGKDIGEFIAPYDLVGFADNGKKIIAYDSSRLFSIPVSSVMADANLIKKASGMTSHLAILILVIVVAPVILISIGWRWASRIWSLPCPSLIGWVLESPFYGRIIGTEKTLDRIGLRPGQRVLEIGTGPGRLLIPAARRVMPGGSVVGIDIQSRMLDRLKTRVEAANVTNLTAIRGDATQPILPEASFDVAYMAAALGEIPDRAAALAQCFRALKSGGLLSITETQPDPHYQSQATVKRVAEAAGFRLQSVQGGMWLYTANFLKP